MRSPLPPLARSDHFEPTWPKKKAGLSAQKSHPSRWLCALPCQGERWDSLASTPPPPIRWTTDLDMHQNNNGRIGMRPQLNQREQSSGGTGARERNREIREEKKKGKKEKGRGDERDRIQNCGCSSFFCTWGIQELIQQEVYIKHISVCQSELKPRNSRGSQHDSTLPRPGSKHSEDFPLAWGLKKNKRNRGVGRNNNNSGLKATEKADGVKGAQNKSCSTQWNHQTVKTRQIGKQNAGFDCVQTSGN